MITQTAVQERRIPGRFRILSPVKYDIEDAKPEKAATCFDLGLKGAKLLMPEPLPVNTRLYLVFHLPESIFKFRAKANVVWQKEAGKTEDSQGHSLTGVDFFVVSEADRIMLSGYIYHQYREELLKFWWRGL